MYWCRVPLQQYTQWQGPITCRVSLQQYIHIHVWFHHSRTLGPGHLSHGVHIKMFWDNAGCPTFLCVKKWNKILFIRVGFSLSLSHACLCVHTYMNTYNIQTHTLDTQCQLNHKGDRNKICQIISKGWFRLQWFTIHKFTLHLISEKGWRKREENKWQCSWMNSKEKKLS